MAKQILLISLSLTILFVNGCKPPPKNDVTKDLDQVLSDIKTKNKKELDNIDDILKKAKVKVEFKGGGDPGIITLAGVIVSSENVDGKVTLKADKRITYEASMGETYLEKEVGPSEAPDSQMPVLIEKPEKKESVAKAGEQKDYIAIGCKSLESKWTVGLKETQLQQSDSMDQLIQANTVILCDLSSLKTAITLISADHLILNQLTYQIVAPAGIGALNLSARKMTLVGANRVVGKGSDLKGTDNIVMTGPSISVEVFEELAGQGTLSLKAIGGNRLKSDQTSN